MFLSLDKGEGLGYSPVISAPGVRKLYFETILKRGLDMAETEGKSDAKIGKWLFYISIVFLFWISWYSMHAPPGFIH